MEINRENFIPIIPANKWDEFNKRMEETIMPKEELERMMKILKDIPQRKRKKLI